MAISFAIVVSGQTIMQTYHHDEFNMILPSRVANSQLAHTKSARLLFVSASLCVDDSLTTNMIVAFGRN